ncbi:MAG: PRC-barrel domain-containing protein [Dokdonella sp.]
MLRNVNDLYGLKVVATNGPIGEIKDCFFDDQRWAIRFFVVETDQSLGGRKILIPPIAVHELDWAAKLLSISLTRERVKASPDVDTSRPVSRQHELEQFSFYGYSHHGDDAQLWGGGPQFGMSPDSYESVELPTGERTQAAYVERLAKLHRDRGDDPHLRSCRAIQRYHIHATDGDIGHVESLLLDDEAWAIRYLVVDTSDWWMGHQMLVAPPWIADISWLDATVSVDLTRQAVKDAPTYDAKALPSPEQERGLFEHYGHSDHVNLVAGPPLA